MSVEKLALHGGSKTIERTFEHYNPIGQEEIDSVTEVMKTGVLSKFLGAWHDDFYGGEKVKQFERECEKYFGVKNAITVNSWTSGLITALGALGIEPGDEVITTPWTMCATATAILQWNAIPVFADIDPVTFCIDPKSVEDNITPQTRAIIAVDICGHSADMDVLNAIATKHNLKIISDTAQAPGSYYKGKMSGTLATIGGYSLNYHKHIHTGEGGILVTDDDRLAEKMRLIRNHAEAVVEQKGETDLTNMLGFNFRLGEIECAIGSEQLKKLESIIARRQEVATRLNEGLSGLEGLMVPVAQENCTHSYYVYPLVLDVEKLGLSRKKIAEALTAEGVPSLAEGYANLHLLPMYQKKQAYGTKGFPWTADFCKRDVSYDKGICPVAEKLQDETFLSFLLCLHELSNEDCDLVVKAFQKVWSQLDQLK